MVNNGNQGLLMVVCQLSIVIGYQQLIIGCQWLSRVINVYQWLSRIVNGYQSLINGYINDYNLSMVIKIIKGYKWLSVSYQWLSMVIGHQQVQWLSMVMVY